MRDRYYVPGCRIYAPGAAEAENRRHSHRRWPGTVHDFYEYAAYYAAAEHVRQGSKNHYAKRLSYEKIDKVAWI